MAPGQLSRDGRVRSGWSPHVAGSVSTLSTESRTSWRADDIATAWMTVRCTFPSAPTDPIARNTPDHGATDAADRADHGTRHGACLSEAEQGTGVVVEDGPGGARVDLGVVNVVDRAQEDVPVLVGEVGSQ